MITSPAYLTLKARIKEELNNIERLENSLKKLGLFPGIKTDNLNGLPLADEISRRVIGSFLHDYYCGLEKAFVHIAESFEESLPANDKWHKKLLEQMTLEIPGVRVPVIKKETMVKIDELRGFRHVFRNAYGFDIDPEKEQALLNNLADISSSVKANINSFFAEMDKIILGS
ncbi:MAG: hypothetical protein H5T98_06705 [Syntrophomonadaceae bacterium]|nr:hypothetical protein [Syntrophomonadaceae bacterium]